MCPPPPPPHCVTTVRPRSSAMALEDPSAATTSLTAGRASKNASGTATGADHPLPKVASKSAADVSSAIAAATAAAIAAGPLPLGSSTSEATTASPLPLLEVRGCTPIGRKSSRFEINLGQQLAHPSSLEWQVSLVWPAAQRMRRGSYSSSLLGAGDNRRILSSGGGAGVGVESSAKPALKFRLYTLHKSDAEWLTLGGQREGQLLEGGVQVNHRIGRWR